MVTSRATDNYLCTLQMACGTQSHGYGAITMRGDEPQDNAIQGWQAESVW